MVPVTTVFIIDNVKYRYQYNVQYKMNINKFLLRFIFRKKKNSSLVFFRIRFSNSGKSYPYPVNNGPNPCFLLFVQTGFISEKTGGRKFRDIKKSFAKLIHFVYILSKCLVSRTGSGSRVFERYDLDPADNGPDSSHLLTPTGLAMGAVPVGGFAPYMVPHSQPLIHTEANSILPIQNLLRSPGTSTL